MQLPDISPWALPCGALVSAGLVFGLLFWQRWQRKRRGERPPQTEKLLRLPGHSLSLRLIEADEKEVNAVTQAMLAGGSLSLLLSLAVPLLWNDSIRHWMATNGGWSAWFQPKVLPSTLGLLLFVVGDLCWLIYELGSWWKWSKTGRNLRLGYRGEHAVGEALATLLAGGYRVFHDFPEKTLGNIDHVVVGPGGVFAIETKTRSRRTAPPGVADHIVRYDGKVLRFPWGEDGGAVPQAERNARWLAGFLTQATGMPVEVSAVLVVPGWYVESTGNYPVKAMNAKYLAKALASQPPRLPPDAIQRIAHQVEQRCRDVEF